MDFIIGFLKVQVYRSVFMVVDRLFKYVVFILAPHECPLKEAAGLFFNNVVKHFRVP